jgi:hypothetical protein
MSLGLPFRNPKSAIRNAFPGSRLPVPGSRRSLRCEIFHNLNVSRIFAETLTSTGTFKKRAHFDQKVKKEGGLRSKSRKKREILSCPS